MLSLFRRIMSNEQVERNYFNVGKRTGDEFSYSEPIFPAHALTKLVPWEDEYARRGYRTVPFRMFILAGGWGQDIRGFFGKKREFGEKPIFYVARQRDEYLGKEIPKEELERIVSSTLEADSLMKNK